MMAAGVSPSRLGVGLCVSRHYQRIQLAQHGHGRSIAIAVEDALDPRQSQLVPVRNAKRGELVLNQL